MDTHARFHIYTAVHPTLHWEYVFRRVIAATRTLVEHDLAFCGIEERFRSLQKRYIFIGLGAYKPVWFVLSGTHLEICEFWKGKAYIRVPKPPMRNSVN